MIKVNVGCGKVDFGEDWIHIDAIQYPHVVGSDIYLYDLRNTIDLIYSSHLLEYFDRDEVKYLLGEWFDALKSGGTLRLAVPDFYEMSRLYTLGRIHLEQILGPLYGKIEVNGNSAYHKTTYDLRSLKILLQELGFKDIKRWDWRKVDHGHIDDCSQAYLPKMDKEEGTLISLNIECQKP